MLISAVELLKQSVNLYKNNFVTILKFLSLLIIPVSIDLAVLFLNETYPLGLWSLIIIQIITKIVCFWFIFNIFRVIHAIYKKEAVASVEITTKETKKILWNGIGTSLAVGLFTFAPLLLLLFIPIFVAGGFSDPRAIAAVLFAPIFVYTAGTYGLTSMLALGMFILFIFGIINALFFGVKLSFATYETVIANKPIKESIKSSMAMTKGRWWAILGRFILTAFVVSLIYELFSAPLSQIFGVGLIYNVFIQIVSLLLTPVAFATAIILYEELKKLGPAQTEQKI